MLLFAGGMIVGGVSVTFVYLALLLWAGLLAELEGAGD